MRSTGDAQTRCKYSLEYGEAIDMFAIASFIFCKEMSCAQDPSARLRYDERHKIMVSGSTFSFFYLKF